MVDDLQLVVCKNIILDAMEHVFGSFGRNKCIMYFDWLMIMDKKLNLDGCKHTYDDITQALTTFMNKKQNYHCGDENCMYCMSIY